MRRIPVSGGSWLLLAAMAVPILLKGAKPLVQKVGKGMRDLGEKLMDETAEAQPAPQTSQPAESQPKATAPRKAASQGTKSRSAKSTKTEASTKKRSTRTTATGKATTVEEDKA